jgi:putative FmdB family regulatory protein
MPLYEFECYVCKHRFERIRRVSDTSPVRCPECQGEVRRLLSAPALQFKGSGWYVTDYGKGNGSRSSALAKTEHERSDAGESSPKSDSRPADKPESKAESKAEKKTSTS